MEKDNRIYINEKEKPILHLALLSYSDVLKAGLQSFKETDQQLMVVRVQEDMKCLKGLVEKVKAIKD